MFLIRSCNCGREVEWRPKSPVQPRFALTVSPKTLAMTLFASTMCRPGGRVQMNLFLNLPTSDRVRVIVRSFLYAISDQPEYHWTGTVSAVEPHDIWVMPDGAVGREEFVAWYEIENVIMI